jgi:kynurenine formamidase
MTGQPPRRPAHRINLSHLQLAGEGRIFDLSSGWWPGMPLAPGHPPFQVVTFRTPAGQRAQADLEFLADNPGRFGFISDMLSFCTHSGTHIDALAHITCGEDDSWHGGYSAQEHLGDFGPLTMDASALPPYLCRGVLIDAPRAARQVVLEAHQPVSRELICRALDEQQVSLAQGDVVLIRTGTMAYWPDPAAMATTEGAGLSLDGARFLSEHRPAAIGSDTAAVEVAPSGIPGEPQPVHRLLIRDLGIPLLEWVQLENLAAAGVHEFLFVCLPIPVTGATGSLVRPVAIA